MEELQLEAQVKIEEITERFQKIDWAALVTRLMVTTVALFRADWGPHMRRWAYGIARAAVWVYMAGYFLGRFVHQANDCLTSLTTVHLPLAKLRLAAIINTWKQLHKPTPTASKPRICFAPRALSLGTSARLE